MEKLIGRRLSSEQPSREHDWLVRWHGYSVTNATWESEKTLGDITGLMARFQEAAMTEGMSTDTDEQILLKEAIKGRPKGGW